MPEFIPQQQYPGQQRQLSIEEQTRMSICIYLIENGVATAEGYDLIPIAQEVLDWVNEGAPKETPDNSGPHSGGGTYL